MTTLRAWMLVSLLAALGAGAAVLAQSQEKMQDKGASFNDAVITELVSSALDGDATLRRMQISVETRDRVVHLTGLVDSMAQVERAGALARGVEGVSAVRNTIRVAIRPPRA